MKKWFYPVSLILLFTILLAAVIPPGYVYGSNTDWLSQHVTLAETIRNACLDQHTLLPSWIGLGGGSNGYQFAYYGFLRPDILIGCLLPQIPMADIVITYMTAVFLSSVLLCFIWLKSESIAPGLAWFGAILFMTAGCLFHLHRQIMFVNYLPFLLLAFLCIRKKRWKWVPLCMLMICLSSFYFAVSAFAAAGWYWYRTEGKRFWKESFLKRYLPCAALAVGMAAALLIPTGLVLLEHHRSSSGNGISTLLELFCPNPVFNNLLFNEYGMGLTLICFYSILAGLRSGEIRKDSLLFLLSGLFGIFSYVLNGMLYARPKILIPFMPLVILHCIRVTRLYITHEAVSGCEVSISTSHVRSDLPRLTVPPLWPFAVILPVSLLWISQEQFPWIMAELGILFCLCLLARLKASDHPAALLGYLRSSYAFSPIRRIASPLCILLLLIAPVGMYFTTAGTNDWVKQKDLFAGFTARELKGVDFDPRWHYDSMLSPLNSANELNTGQIRSTMYSSVTNAKYSELYYDTLMTPVRINNRVALLTSPNPFMLQLLGVRYLETSAGQIPAGYHVIRKSGDAVLAENENVLPSVYFTDDTIPQEWFDKQDAYDQLDLITRKTVVDDPLRTATGTVTPDAESFKNDIDSTRMRTYEPELSLSESAESSGLPDGLTVSRAKDGWEITSDRNCTLTLDINNPLPGNIVLCQFRVTNQTFNAVVIDINGIRNKLSGMFAPYPNGNNNFHYQFATDNDSGVERLEITFSKGHYRLTDIQWRLYDSSFLHEKKFTPLTDSGTVTASVSGYLATSVPMQNGLEILVDGRPADLVRVNKAFAGVHLEKGTHTIEMHFTPPGKTVGCIFSAAALSGYSVWLIISEIRYMYTSRGAGGRSFTDSRRISHCREE